METLEHRVLPSAGAEFAPILFIPAPCALTAEVAQLAGSSAPDGFTPQEIQSAYGINAIQVGSVVGNGLGQTIAIVDAYDDPALVSSTASNFLSSDLHEFDAAMGLADPPSFLKLDESGGTNYPRPIAGK